MNEMQQDTEFRGAKLALFLGAKLAVIMRDDRPGLPWPGYLDLPGGGREGRETPQDCALRETREELGLNVRPEEVVWGQRFRHEQDGAVWFFAAHLPEARVQDVRFGDEGQYWALMAAEEYLIHPRGIPHFKARLRLYLEN
ncbi:NUDIX hydrolase [Thalassovita taeanensis]|uniref:8-oxo-dGTP diphosphatase n=1 Tax=Thalassovita taeanensis TaxID=657014 RepID=A0A1H9IN86_9RHOB|nr:NUDIX hydrolase [Thalassovita taeanensis]SEQ76083.1 8-oxo-dGTP diphosphatase [Thalassovita taeanensis]